MDFRTLIAGVVGLLASCMALAAPEPPPFRQLGVAEGLPSSRLTGLAQDRDGYLWIGTRDGLARFDGVGYAIHRQTPGVPGGLPGNFVQTVFVDSSNRVWVGIEGQGFCVLGSERRAFRQYSQATRPLLRSDDVWAIAETPDGYLWFGTFGGGLYRLDREDRLTRFLPAKDRADSLPDENVLSLAVDPRGVLWVGTSSGLARWTGSGFERMPEGSTSGDIILSLSADAAGELWIGTDQGLDLRHADGRFEAPSWRAQLPDPGVNSVLRDRAGAHWIATSRGLVREHAGVVDTMAGSAAAGAPMNISLEDNEGGLWFASENAGLLRLPADWRRFRVFRAAGERFAATPFRGVAPAREGGAWLAAGKGRLDYFDPRELRLSTALDLEAELPGARLWSVLERVDGQLWLGHTKGLSRFDPHTRAWRHWRQDDARAGMLTGPVRLLAEDETGLLWLASYGGGVQARDREGALVHSFEPGQGGIDTPEQDQLARGPDNALWLAGPKGLLRWNAARQRFEPVPGAPTERVYGFALQEGGLLWLHRIGALESYRWDGAGLRRELSMRAGASLPAVESGGVMIDRAGRAWVASARGLLRYDVASGRLRNFGIPDGLPAQEFQSLAPMLLPTGEALVGSGDALVLFDPAAIALRSAASPLVLDSVRLRGENGEQALRADGVALTLQPEDRDLRVSARLLSFADPAAHRYRFRLHGYEAGWIEAGNAGERVFSRLEPGDYRLEVAARNAEGVWSPARGFPLRVLAPWWQRPWAIAAWTALGLLALVVAARAYRQRVRDRHAEVLREQRRQLADQGSAAKTRFLANLGHEIRTPMTGVLGMAELLQAGALDPKQERQVQAIRRAGEHLLRLVDPSTNPLCSRIERSSCSYRAILGRKNRTVFMNARTRLCA